MARSEFVLLAAGASQAALGEMRRRLWLFGGGTIANSMAAYGASPVPGPNQRSEPMKLKSLGYAALLALAAAPLVQAQRPASSAKSGPAKASSTTRPASTTAVQPAGRKTIDVYDALVMLIEDVRVPAEEAGRLMKLLVKEGEFVEAGTVLAEIDNRDTLAKQRIAQAEIDVATEQFKSDAEIEVAEKAIEVSKAEYDSNLSISQKSPGAVSETELRKFRFQWERALAQLKVAQVDKVVASLTVDLKKAQYEATTNELARRQITAPFSGEVNDVLRQVGEWVQPGDQVVHLVRLDKVRVKGFVYAKNASPTELAGKPVTIVVTTAGGKEETVRGVIDFASQVIEGVGDTRQFRIWADIDNKRVTDPVSKRESWAIQPGSSAKMEIDLSPQVAARPVIETTPAVAPAGGPSLTPAGSFVPRTPAVGTPKVETRKPVADEAATKVRER
jgi:multidrug efflux pump subunit AcrA (membrane-fusion protein)